MSIIALVLVLALQSVVKTPATPPAPPPLTAELRPLVDRVTEAIEAERAAQAALPPAEDDAETLRRMGRLDQVGRSAMSEIDLEALSPEATQAVMANVWTAIGAVDLENQTRLLDMVPAEGWFLKSRYGSEAANAAFLIVQHSSPDLWRRFLPVLEPLVPVGEVDGQVYAMMFDRLAMMEGRPQRYGTQMRCIDGRWSSGEIEDRASVDARRRAMGIAVAFADYEARFAARPACG